MAPVLVTALALVLGAIAVVELRLDVLLLCILAAAIPWVHLP